MTDGDFGVASAADPEAPEARIGVRWPVLIGCVLAGMAAGGLFYARVKGLLFLLLAGPPLLLANVTRVGHLVAPNHGGLAIVIGVIATLHYIGALLPLIVPGTSRRAEGGYKTVALVWMAAAGGWYGIMIVVVWFLIRA